MCRNIWSTQIKNEILSVFGRDYFEIETDLPEMPIAPGSFERHEPLYSVKLSECVSPSLIEECDSRIRKFAEENPKYHFVEGSSIGDFYLNVMPFLMEHPSEYCNQRILKVFVSVEARADEDDPNSLLGFDSPQYAVFIDVFRASEYQEVCDRGKMIRDAVYNTSHKLSTDYVEFLLRDAVEHIDDDMYFALQTMLGD